MKTVKNLLLLYALYQISIKLNLFEKLKVLFTKPVPATDTTDVDTNEDEE